MSPAQDARRRWARLGAVPLDALAGARDETHWALQLVAAAGQSFATPTPDDAHRGCVFAAGSFVGEALDRAGGAHVSLTPAEGIVTVRTDGSEVTLSLAGKTLDDAKEWLAEQLAQFHGGAPELAWPEFEIPPHPVGSGTPFGVPAAEHAELMRWYHDSDLVLSHVAAATYGASGVRVWPHHFDIASLISVDGESGEEARSIGLGMSPGDTSYADPYFYVNVWPYPNPERLPALDLGTWHTEGWTGAVFLADEIVGADRQAERVQSFIERAIAAGHRALASKD